MAKILVIEDEELIRESIVNILSIRGFNTMGAIDGRMGLQLAKEFLPDLILGDIRMPEIDGYKVLEYLRQDPLTASIPLIFITAETTKDVFERGQKLGANGYLIKPFATAQLLETISLYLKKE